MVKIPKSSVFYGSRKINNLLIEFMGMVINVWLTCLEPGSDQACILAIGDNTSAICWLHSTSRLDPTWGAHSANLVVARKLAQLLMEHQCCLASQRKKEELNLVSDWLSFLSGSERGKHHPLAFDNPADDVPSRPDSGELRNLTAAQRDIILDNSSAANRFIIFDEQEEGSNESHDRTWRRWVGFCTSIGDARDPLLSTLFLIKQEHLGRTFISLSQTAAWNTDDQLTGARAVPMVSGT